MLCSTGLIICKKFTQKKANLFIRKSILRPKMAQPEAIIGQGLRSANICSFPSMKRLGVSESYLSRIYKIL